MYTYIILYTLPWFTNVPILQHASIVSLVALWWVIGHWISFQNQLLVFWLVFQTNTETAGELPSSPYFLQCIYNTVDLHVMWSYGPHGTPSNVECMHTWEHKTRLKREPAVSWEHKTRHMPATKTRTGCFRCSSYLSCHTLPSPNVHDPYLLLFPNLWQLHIYIYIQLLHL